MLWVIKSLYRLKNNWTKSLKEIQSRIMQKHHFTLRASLKARRTLWGCTAAYSFCSHAFSTHLLIAVRGKILGKVDLRSNPVSPVVLLPFEGVFVKKRPYSLPCTTTSHCWASSCSAFQMRQLFFKVLSTQTEEFPFITLTTSWSLNAAEESAPPFSPLCPAIYLTEHTCGSGRDLEGK